VDRLLAKNLSERTITVFDEAHLINDLFTEHNSISISEDQLQKISIELSASTGSKNLDTFKVIAALKAAMQSGINESNYVIFLEHLKDVYDDAFDACAKELQSCNIQNQNKYSTLTKMSRKYKTGASKINDFLTHKYAHAIDFKQKNAELNEPCTFNLKPIFVKSMFKHLVNAHFNLLMSGTISKEFVNQTLDLPDSTYIRLEPSFPKENKEVIFYKTQNLNYNSMKDQKVLSELKKTCSEIVHLHSNKSERGVIMSPSFYMNDIICAHLKKSKINTKIIQHNKGEKLSEVLNAFKKCKGNAVLITPSGFEGLDLPGDLSRFQIILKAPFGSLGEERMKYILNNYPDMYSLLTLMKIVQATGRSVRSKDDYAKTYILDSNAERLWLSNLNEWKDECTTKFASVLEK